MYKIAAKKGYESMVKRFLLIVTAVAAPLFATIDDPFSLMGSPDNVQCQSRPDSKSVYTLFDVIRQALCANPQTKEASAYALYRAAQHGVDHAAYLPTMSATASESRTKTTAQETNSKTDYTQQNFTATISYLLYDFGGRKASLESSKKLFEAATASREEAVQNVFLSALQSYYQLFAAQASLDAYREAEASALQSLNASAARYGAGAATPADKLQAKTAHSQAVLNRIKADGELQNARGALAVVMGFEPNAEITHAFPSMAAPDSGFEQNVEELLAQAKQHRPALQASTAQIEASKADVEAAKAAGMPNLSLSSGFNYTDGARETAKSGTIGLYLNIPIFSGFNTTYKIKAAKEQLKINEARHESTNRQVALDTWKAYQGLKVQTQALRSADDLLQSAQKSLEVVRGRYKAGVGNIIDLLNAQTAAASAAQQKISAAYGWHTAKAYLAWAMGRLDADYFEGKK